MTEGPWEWRPRTGAWAAGLIEKTDRWEPAKALRLDADRIRAVLADSALAASPWLRHPLVSRLTKPEPADSYRDLILAAWASAGTQTDLGTVELEEQVLLWSGAGDQAVDAGRHELSTLGALIAEPPPIPLGLDLWCRATGVVTPGSWPALSSSAIEEREPELAASIGRYLRTIAVLADRCPDLMSWITSATTVVRPLAPVADVARSSHDPEIPGLIEADISGGPALIIELLVHETAHRHLRMAQAAADLVDPAHHGRYQSSLRTDSRPLIGILLAYHALAYVCVALAEASHAGIIAPEVEEAVVTDLRCRRDDARDVLQSARSHLTDAGADFMLHTDQVAGHVVP